MTLVVVAVGSWRLFVRPAVDDPVSADAVVMFAGGKGERLETALELVNSGVASVLVIPNGNVDNWDEANELCSRAQDFAVHCFAPETENTRGEARGIGRLAEANGWTSLVAVSSTYHLTRVKTLLERCTTADVAVVGAEPNLSIASWIDKVGHEWGGYALAQTFSRSC